MTGLGVSSVLFNLINTNFMKSYTDAKNYLPTFIMAAVTAVLAALCMILISRHLKKVNS